MSLKQQVTIEHYPAVIDGKLYATEEEAKKAKVKAPNVTVDEYQKDLAEQQSEIEKLRKQLAAAEAKNKGAE